MPATRSRSVAAMSMIRCRVAIACAPSMSNPIPASGRANCTPGRCTMSPQISSESPPDAISHPEWPGVCPGSGTTVTPGSTSPPATCRIRLPYAAIVARASRTNSRCISDAPASTASSPQNRGSASCTTSSALGNTARPSRVHQAADMVGMQMRRQHRVHVARRDPDRRQMRGEAAHVRPHHAAAAAIHQHQPVRQVHQEGVHRHPRRHRAEAGLVQRRCLRRLDPDEPVERAVELAVVQGGHDDVADRKVMHARRLAVRTGWHGHGCCRLPAAIACHAAASGRTAASSPADSQPGGRGA